MTKSFHLPVPEQRAREHSRRLVRLIQEQVEKNGGSISFERYMEMALHEPGWGYYSAGAARFGAPGDFTTAPHVSPLFSRCVARQCGQVLSSMSSGDILEIGAGSGVMAKDMLLELASADTLPDNYFILETSADLRMRQKELFESHIPHLLSRVHWLDTLPETPVNGVIVANEVIDAMPVKRILLDKGSIYEMYVGHRDDEFYWIEEELQGAVNKRFEAIASNLQAPMQSSPQAPMQSSPRASMQSSPQSSMQSSRQAPMQSSPQSSLQSSPQAPMQSSPQASIPGPYLTEVNAQVDGWLKSMSAALGRGMILIIDYGYPQHEYYHPQRNKGTLLCHYRHRCHEDPFFYPGLQDITASVDFTALAQAAVDNEMQVAGYASQAHFLIGCGLEDMAPGFQNDDEQPDPAVSGQIKLLTLPGEMGERFKALALARDCIEPLIGFQFIDQRQRLWRG